MRAFVGLGSNLGDRHAYIDAAICGLSNTSGIELVARASIWESAPLGPAEFDFLNTVVELRTTLEPVELLRVLQGLERDAGRSREIKWGPRTLDLDLLLMIDEDLGLTHSTDEALRLPHPAIVERDFVLAPLAELIPNLQLAGRPLQEWLDLLPAEQRTLMGAITPGEVRARRIP